MAEYIRKEDVRAKLFNGEHNLYSWEEIEEKILAIPDADVVEQKTGKWEWDHDGMDWNLGAWVCSNCHCKPETWWEAQLKVHPLRCSGSHYCGNCGAKMTTANHDS